MHASLHSNNHNLIVNKENESVLCELCGMFLINRDHFENHLAQHIEEQRFVCGHCQKSFKSETRYIHHIGDKTVHLKENKCPLCLRMYSTQQCLQRHIKMHTRETNFACPVCYMPSLTKTKLEAHQRIHSPKHRCRTCLETFQSKLMLIRHHRSVHGGNSMFQCNKCTKKYRKQGHLQNHLRNHEDSAVQAENYHFQCNECHKAFRTKGNLIFHQRNHNLFDKKLI